MLMSIYISLENNEYLINILIDLRKSSGTVDHNILLLRRKHYGLTGHVFITTSREVLQQLSNQPKGNLD